MAGLGLVTLVGFGGLGWGLSLAFHHQDVATQLGLSEHPWPRQLWQGLLYGLVASANILWLLHHRILAEPRHVFAQLIRGFRLRPLDMIFLSLCAGIGEEWLFRGAIQPWLGIWPTAIVFVGIHGYLDPRDSRMLLYGALMAVVVGGFGYLAEQSGLMAAMTAHAVIDIAIFGTLLGGGRWAFGRRPPTPNKRA